MKVYLAIVCTGILLCNIAFGLLVYSGGFVMLIEKGVARGINTHNVDMTMNRIPPR